MWNIKIENQNKFDCYIAALVSFANHNKIEPLIVYLSTWCYRYNSTVGEQINQRSKNIIEKYYGICTIREALNGIDSLSRYLVAMLAVSPVIISIDDHVCPWSTGYKKYHLNRHILISDIKNDGIECLDFKYPNKTGLFLSFFELQNWTGYAEYICLRNNNCLIKETDCKNELMETIVLNRKENIIDRIHDLKDYLNTSNFIENNIRRFSMDFHDTHILIHITRFIDDRLCFCNGLSQFQDMYGKSDKLLNLQTCVMESAKLANALKSIIMKQIMKNKSNNNSINNCIDRIIELEKIAISIF